MGHRPLRIAAIALLMLTAGAAFGGDPGVLPVRGLHVFAPAPGEMADCLRFIREALPKEGVNVLVIEFNYRYRFTKRPEVVDPDVLVHPDVPGIGEQHDPRAARRGHPQLGVQLDHARASGGHHVP